MFDAASLHNMLRPTAVLWGKFLAEQMPTGTWSATIQPPLQPAIHDPSLRSLASCSSAFRSLPSPSASFPSLLAAQVAGVPERPLPDSPFVIDTAEAGQVRVTPMKGLELPWDLAFLPNGDMLVTERTAMRLRVVRNGVLQPQPITGLPEGMSSGGGGGLMSVAVASAVRRDGLGVPDLHEGGRARTARPGTCARAARGMALEDVRELFTVDEAGGGPPPGLPLVFAPDGYLYFFIGGANDEIAQRGDSYYGKVLRFNDDGSVPRESVRRAARASRPRSSRSAIATASA